MRNVNAAATEFDAIEYKGEYALICQGQRLDKSTIPEGFHVYAIRENESCDPGAIEESVSVDFYGSIIFNHPLEIPESGYIEIGGDDINWLGYEATLVDPWMNTEPLMEQKM